MNSPDTKREVKIVSWPKEKVKLEHSFDSDKPCPVSIGFEKTPANVIIHTSPENPMNVDMNMKVTADKTIPVCIKLCEPICAKSDYSIGIDIFDRPVAGITIRGLTRLFNCREEHQPPKPTCVDFSGLKEGTIYRQPFSYKTLTFVPLDDSIVVKNIGEPNGRPKLVFPTGGMRIEFPFEVRDVSLLVNNYSAPYELKIDLYSGSTVVDTVIEHVEQEAKQISISISNISAIEIKGGSFEASVAQVCFYSN